MPGAAATKAYRCPGCNQLIPPATPHVVAWPDRARPVVRLRSGRAPALAHRLLAAPAHDRPTSTASCSAPRPASTGPRVVFLHGLFGQGKNWTTVAKALSDQARVTLVDLPNHGRSAWTDHFSYPEMADQVAGLLGPRAPASRTPWSVTRWAARSRWRWRCATQRWSSGSAWSISRRSRRAGSAISPTSSAGCARSTSRRLTDRESAECRSCEPYVPEPGVRSFLLQNLRRDHGRDPGWRWQMNLQLLGRSARRDGLPGPNWTCRRTPDRCSGWPAPTRATSSPSTRRPCGPCFRASNWSRIKGAGHWVHSDQPQVFIATIRQFLHL